MAVDQQQRQQRPNAVLHARGKSNERFIKQEEEEEEMAATQGGWNFDMIKD